MKSFFADRPVLLATFRWILFLPGGLAAGFASAYIWRFGMNTGYAGNAGEVFYELSLTNGFAGNFFLGPVLVVGEMVITSFCGMFAALYLVPKSRAVVGGILIGMLIMMGVFTFIMQCKQFEYLFPFEARIRFCLEWVGILIGCVLAIKTVSNFMTDYVRDGVYNLDQAVEASWNSLMMGNVIEKISTIEKNRQLEMVKKSLFYSSLSPDSKKVVENELCSFSWSGRQNEKLIMAILCKILEIEMREEVCSWELSVRRSLGIDWESMSKGTIRNKFKKFSKSKKIKNSLFSLGELLNIFNKLVALLNSDEQDFITDLKGRYSKKFLDFLESKNFSIMNEPLRLFRNAMAHGNSNSNNDITLNQIIGFHSLDAFFELENNESECGVLTIFLNRNKA